VIDYALKFTDEAAAITAATGTALGQNDAQSNWQWNTHFVLPNVKAWRISQDNTDGSHTYLTGWYCIVSVQKPNAQLTNDPNLAFALDRDGPPYVLKNNIGPVISDVNCEPIFAGSHYPIGGWN
jgi:hypothetical protein